MTRSSFPIFLSSSSSCRRLVTLISFILLNPLPIIYGAPTPKSKNELSAHRHKRNLVEEEYFAPRPDAEIKFEGLIGCKYDEDLCNENELCFDDELFGQCWDGKDSIDSSFVLSSGLDGLTDDKLIALDLSIEFLKSRHLDWKDYMTQCILSHVLTDVYRIDQDRLESFYENCLLKDEILDEISEQQQEQEIQENFERRQSSFYEIPPNFPLEDPFFKMMKSNIPLNRNQENYDVSILFEEEPNLVEFERTKISPFPFDPRKSSLNRKIFIENLRPVLIEETGRPLLIEESSMSEPRKLTVHTNEGHPGLLETLQINNNKQLLPVLTEEAMMRKNLTKNFETENVEPLKNVDTSRYFAVEAARGYIVIDRDFKDQIEGARLLSLLAQINSWPAAIFNELNADRRLLTFHVADNAYQINASHVAAAALANQKAIENQLGLHVADSGIGNPRKGVQLSSVEQQNGSRLTIITLVICASVLLTMAAFALLYLIKRNDRVRNKIAEITHIKGLSNNYYQDLCRQRMQVQPTTSGTAEIHKIQAATTMGAASGAVTSSTPHAKHNSEASSNRSSTSSWSEEPVAPVNMDIMTGHLILSYMEDHLRDRHRLEAEWQALYADESSEERAPSSIAVLEHNANKNRYIDCIPYDHNRIRLSNSSDDDYINASAITDSDPKCKYIATQGPLPNTTNAFWQMVWEQGSCVIVALTRPIENGITMCHHYWPVEGSARFNDFEVNLVSEHIWSDDYLVRSFYLKNVQTMETRTVTQFHFLTWGELNTPASAKALLDFRRKVNKCFRGRSSPIIVHCNDGIGRTGTFILLDIVLNRICKGAREINIAATLEHIRDQRAKMVKTKEQFEFVFVAVAEEVTHLLKAIPQ